jgi:hypothetical protein
MARKMSQYNAKCEGAGLGYVQQAEVSVYPFVVSAMIARADPRTPADPTRLLRIHNHLPSQLPYDANRTFVGERHQNLRPAQASLFLLIASQIQRNNNLAVASHSEERFSLSPSRDRDAPGHSSDEVDSMFHGLR